MIIARRFNGLSSCAVPELPSAAPLPAGFILPPGYYTNGGKTYDCTAEGAYRWWTPLGGVTNRIVYSSDIDSLMSGIAWAVAHGSADAGSVASSLTTAATFRKLRLLCNDTATWAKALCDTLSPVVPSRIVRVLTAQTPTGYYDGHVLLEVKAGNNWRTYDLAAGLSYQNPNGSWALKDVVPLQSNITRTPLAVKAYDVTAPPAGGFDVTAWAEDTLRETFAAEWARVLQIPGIDNIATGETWWYLPPGTESRQAWVLGLQANYRVKDLTTWMGAFYP